MSGPSRPPGTIESIVTTGLTRTRVGSPVTGCAFHHLGVRGRGAAERGRELRTNSCQPGRVRPAQLPAARSLFSSSRQAGVAPDDGGNPRIRHIGASKVCIGEVSAISERSLFPGGGRRAASRGSSASSCTIWSREGHSPPGAWACLAATSLTTMQRGTVRVRVWDGPSLLLDRDPVSPRSRVVAANIKNGNRQIAHGVSAGLGRRPRVRFSVASQA